MNQRCHIRQSIIYAHANLWPGNVFLLRHLEAFCNLELFSFDKTTSVTKPPCKCQTQSECGKTECRNVGCIQQIIWISFKTIEVNCQSIKMWRYFLLQLYGFCAKLHDIVSKPSLRGFFIIGLTCYFLKQIAMFHKHHSTSMKTSRNGISMLVLSW